MTFEATHNAIRSRFKTQWGSTLPVAYSNAEFTPPSTDAGWVRLTIEDGWAFQASMGAPTNFYRHTGLIIVSIFMPLNAGDKAVLQRADEAAAIFRSWQDATTRLRCKTPHLTRVGPDDKWYHVNVTTPFERDTLF